MPPETPRPAAAARLAAALALVLAAGCASPPAPAAPPVETPARAPEPPPAPAPPPPQLAEAPSPPVLALAHADRVRGLPPTELAQEIARLAAIADAEPDRGAGTTPPLTQVQLALTLLQTRSALDALRAGQLLQRVLGQTTPDARALHPLARQLQAQLAEQKRLEDQLERQAQQLRDAQRRTEQLNERLDALRAIERSRPRPQ